MDQHLPVRGQSPTPSVWRRAVFIGLRVGGGELVLATVPELDLQVVGAIVVGREQREATVMNDALVDDEIGERQLELMGPEAPRLVLGREAVAVVQGPANRREAVWRPAARPR